MTCHSRLIEASDGSWCFTAITHSVPCTTVPLDESTTHRHLPIGSELDVPVSREPTSLGDYDDLINLQIHNL